MKNTSCPYRGDMCWSYGQCEDCTWSKIMNKNKRYRKIIKQQKATILEKEKRINELEQDLIHADEKVFYREANVILRENELKDKGALELAQKIEAYFAYYQGENFTTEQFLDTIKEILIKDFNLKEI